MRPDWDDYFLGIARAVAARGECTRDQVGAVVVRDRRIVSTGYNGAPAGHPSCLEGHCPRSTSQVPPSSSYDTGPGFCIAIHAEANALLYGDRSAMEGGTMYLTRKPCDGCMKLILGAGISAVVWAEGSSTVILEGLS